MRALLDINVVIALLDPDHIFSEKAHDWWSKRRSKTWASCPIIQNGVIRIMSTPGYRRNIQFSQIEVIGRLQDFLNQTDHEFWSDDISLLDGKIFQPERIYSSKQITDLYLLALATVREQQLVTLDQGISSAAVKAATSENLVVI